MKKNRCVHRTNFPRSIFHYVCLFMEGGGIIQATDGKGPDYPYKSYLFKYWLERTVHFKGFSWVCFCVYNFCNLLQKSTGFTPSSHLYGVKLAVGMRKLSPIQPLIPKGKRQPSLRVLPKEHTERCFQCFHTERWT